MAFLQGLRKLGKGNWRQISKSFVPSRTPTQVASHAQKHFMRVAGATKRKSRFTALEVEVIAASKVDQSTESDQGQGSQQCPEQQPASALQPSSFPHMATAFTGMPFPFMHPMMFGFPGPFFAPFMCPPPAFAAAALNAMQKQGNVAMMMPPMFPMAAMAAMNPFFMAQQMAAAAQAAAANAAAAAQVAASGGGTTAGTGATTTTDTANSDEVPPRQLFPPGSPGVCKPEPQHARPVTAATGSASGPDQALSTPAASDASGEGASSANHQDKHSAGGGLLDHVPLTLLAPPPRPEDGGPVAFQSSSHSAFRPPQEIKAEF